MKLNPLIIKAYDIRGRYSRKINDAVVAAIARAFVVAIGRNVRLAGHQISL